MMKIRCFLVIILSFCQAEAKEDAHGTQVVSYNFQVKPLLANHCFRCHGPDEKTRKGKLRLDVAEEAFAKEAWKSGHPESSEAIKRLFSADEEEVMPPPDEPTPMTAEEREVLKTWVAQGAKYEQHWAFAPPVKPAVPEFPASADSAPKSKSKSSKVSKKPAGSTTKASGSADFPLRNPIDAFVLQKLVAAGLEPSKHASPETLLRRMTLDLVGLPPTLAEIDAMLADKSATRWETVADRLLASPAFGERLATEWLDAARYADSYGRHEDADSPVWPYRDWVVKAFNDNLPYDKFLLWQTAGDLLPGSTQEQKMATAFNRLANQSNEAGSNEEEFRQDIIADRVKTNATAILGLTMECARCHDHKYDPVSTKDYYSFAAYLNNINELGLYSESTAGIPAPTIYLFNEAQANQHEALVAKVRQAESRLEEVVKSGGARWAAWKASRGMPPAATPSDHFSFEPAEKSGKKGEKSTKRGAPNVARPKDEVNLFKAVFEHLPGIKGQGMILDGSNALQVLGRGEFRRSNPFSFSL
jgi:hypothetical protein